MIPVRVDIEQSCQVAIESLNVYLGHLGASEVTFYGAGKNAQYFLRLADEKGVQVAVSIDDSAAQDCQNASVCALDNYLANYDRLIPLFITLDPRAYSSAIKRILARFEMSCTPVFYLDGLLQLKPSAWTKRLLDRTTADACLYQFVQHHHVPNSVVDVGAAFGKWSVNCSRYFCESNYLLIEPLENEFSTYLEYAMAELPADVEKGIEYYAADAAPGEKTFNVHENWTSSSLFNEVEGKSVDGQQRSIACARLDDLVKPDKFPPPYFIKLDTQGNELNVLMGSESILQQAQVVWMEVSFFPVFIEGPTFHDVLNAMTKLGFVLYDLVGLTYRLYDRALWQADAVFVPKTSMLLDYSGYATAAQRLQQVANFKNNLS